MARPDPHSVTDDTQPATRHLELDAQVDFATRRLTCTTTLHFREAAADAGPLDLDTRSLEVTTVTDTAGVALTWEWLAPDAVLGTPLRIHLPKGTTGVRVSSRTAPDASALQWLEPSMTHGGKQPFLFSQCQAIHARSVLPCQDTSWLQTHRFGAVTTDDFLAHFSKAAPGLMEKVNALRWIDEPGVPDDAPRATSSRLDAVKALTGTVPSKEETATWTAIEWQLFLEWSPHTLTPAQLTTLDERFHFSSTKNAEVHVAWLLLALHCQHDVVLPAVEAFLNRVGRMKYLKPLYTTLHGRASTRALAAKLFEQNRPRLHPIARSVVGGLLAKTT